MIKHSGQTGRTGKNHLNVETTSPHALQDDDEHRWQAIQQAVPGLGNPLFSPQFARVVARHRPDTRVAIARNPDGTAFAFLPYQHRPDGLGRPLSAPFGDYQTVITEKREGFDIQRFLAAAGIRRFAFSGLVGAGHMAATADLPQTEAYQVVLDGAGTDYLEALRAGSPKRYKNWRRLGHKTEREIGPLSMVAPDRDPAVLRQLLDWKAAQMVRTGVTNVLRPAWVQEMMAELMATDDGPFGGLMLTLWAGSTLLGGHFGIRLGGVFHPWIAAINPDYQDYSPGQTFIMQAIGEMNQLGLTTYDLGTGHAHYKAPFCNASPLVASGRLDSRTGIATPPNRSLLGKVSSRLDHIASVELTLGGRLGGILAMGLYAGARLRHRGEDDANEMGA